MKPFPFLPTPARWQWTAVLLLAAAGVFRFAMRGYDYIGHTLTLAALLVVLHHFLPHKIWILLWIPLGLGLLWFIIVEIPVWKAAHTDAPDNMDYVVVLGAAVHGDTPSLALQNRLQGVMDYLENSPDTVIIVSGGQGKGENRTEADCMAQWLREHGVPEDRILQESASTSTLENLSFSYEIIRSRGDDPDGCVAIASSVYHLYRAKEISETLGVSAAGVAGHIDYPLCTLNYFIREAFAVTKLWILGP